MKILILSLLTFASSAQALNMSKAFEGVTPGAPKCFVRNYSQRHLKSKPMQTVERIKVKLEQKKYGEDVDYLPVLSIQVLRKGENHVWSNSIACMDNKEEGTVMCAIECDGGSVEMTAINNKGMLVLKNNGVTLYGGCGEFDEKGNEIETIFLESKPNGDDRFVLPRARASDCADMKEPRF